MKENYQGSCPSIPDEAFTDIQTLSLCVVKTSRVYRSEHFIPARGRVVVRKRKHREVGGLFRGPRKEASIKRTRRVAATS